MPRNYRREYDKYQGTEKQKHNRALRNKARRQLQRAGQVRKGDGKDVDHKRPLIKGGSAAKSNLRVRSRSSNRSFSRTSKHRMK